MGVRKGVVWPRMLGGARARGQGVCQLFCNCKKSSVVMRTCGDHLDFERFCADLPLKHVWTILFEESCTDLSYMKTRVDHFI